MRKKIRTDELQIGMYIVDIERPWTKHPFLSKKKRITSLREIQELKQYDIREVTVELSSLEQSAREGLEENSPLPSETADGREEPPSLLQQIQDSGEVSFEEETEAAREIVKEAHTVIRDYLQDIRMGRSVETEGIRKTVDRMIQSVFRNRDALASLTRIKGYDEYTFVHSINVCILSITLGRHLQFGIEQLQQIGIGGLLHDAGKMRIPPSILNKPGKVTEEEFSEIKKHPIYTLEYLEQEEGIPEASKILGLQHHERCNGQGYPYGLTEGEISLFGQIAAIVDVYDAVTSDRCYKKAIFPWEGVRMIYLSAQKNEFNLALTEQFIQCMGVYPIGSVVQLETGEVGVVHSLHRDKLLLPRVLLIYSDLKNPYPEPVLVDLAERPGSPRSSRRSITRPLNPAEFKIDVDRYLSGPPIQ
jgi:HD-GYP domain-containing protein (c-di-GMP phosphodiesterase class II)